MGRLPDRDVALGSPSNLGSFRGVCGNTGGVPLYACDSCGFTSAAFRVDAAAAHRLEYPECGGAIRIVFRSDDRYRGPVYAPRPTDMQSAATHESRQGEAPAGQHEPAFVIREGVDPDGALRLTLLGDLDLAVAETLGSRLSELKAAGRPVRLDLSRLAFIDSSGVQALLVALTDARWTGWPLEVAPDISPSVGRAARVVGIAQVLWPPASGTNRTGTTLKPAPQ